MSHVTWQQLEWLKIEIVWNTEALESGGGGSQTSNVGKMVACSGLYLQKGGVPLHHCALFVCLFNTAVCDLL